MPKEKKKLLSVQQVADMFKVSHQTVRRWVDRNELKLADESRNDFLKVRRWFFDPDVVEEFRQKHLSENHSQPTKGTEAESSPSKVGDPTSDSNQP